MCEFLSFVATWEEGKGLQVYASDSLRGHSEAVSKYGLQERDVYKFAWEQDGEAALTMSHGQTLTPDAERARQEVLRLWPERHELVTYLLQRNPRVAESLDLRVCTSLTQLPEGLSVAGSLYLSGCTSLRQLPEGLSVAESLDLRGCTSLTQLPEGLSVSGYIYRQ